MKQFLLALSFITINAFSQDLPGTLVKIPEYLKGAIITVTLKNGEQHQFKSEEYMVVPRRKKLVMPSVTKNKTVEKKTFRVYAVGGVGQQGFTLNQAGSTYTIKTKHNPVFGLGVMKDVNNFNLGVLGLSNGTVLGTVGKDF